jgi:hypothetical protein
VLLFVVHVALAAEPSQAVTIAAESVTVTTQEPPESTFKFNVIVQATDIVELLLLSHDLTVARALLPADVLLPANTTFGPFRSSRSTRTAASTATTARYRRSVRKDGRMLPPKPNRGEFSRQYNLPLGRSSFAVMQFTSTYECDGSLGVRPQSCRCGLSTA